MPEKSRFAWTGAARNRWVMMTFLLFAPANKRWLGWRKTENPEGTAWVDFVTFIVQSYFDTLLRCVLSVTFCGAAFLKVMDQKTLVKRRWSYKVCITVYISINSCQTRIYKSLIGNNSCQSIFLSLRGNKTLSQRLTSLSPAERWMITEIRRQSNSMLTYSRLTDALL